MGMRQGYGVGGIGVIARAAALHNPGITGRWGYSALLVIFAGLGGGVAMRHAWLEHNPPKVFDCGADLGYMVESLPLADALPMIFRGTGDCTKVLGRFSGPSRAERVWSWVSLFLCRTICMPAARAEQH